MSESKFWLALWLGLAVLLFLTIVGSILAVRLTPNPTIECVKAGGTWSSDHTDGYCRKVGAP